MKPVHISAVEAANQRGIHRSWGSQVWMANRALSGSSLALARMVLTAGESGEAHRHPNADEVLFLFKGRIAVHVGTEIFRLEPGDALTIPGELAHRIENTGGDDAEMILSYSTGEREYVAE